MGVHGTGVSSNGNDGTNLGPGASGTVPGSLILIGQTESAEEDECVVDSDEAVDDDVADAQL